MSTRERGTEPTSGAERSVPDAWNGQVPDQRLDNKPYRIFFASGDYTCSVARFRGTMTGPMKARMGP